ncbi:helix-turn-helix domain-containing protein [Actinophytocola sp.]|uniref:helix-turn-helix domain-containing protein n=1 Tax=Actinophytocola sp. TaxID=1872138 RepID=UPI003C72C776
MDRDPHRRPRHGRVALSAPSGRARRGRDSGQRPIQLWSGCVAPLSRQCGHRRFPTVSTKLSSPAQQAREALGARLREIRKGAGLTGRALAVGIGCHFTKVSRIENGGQAPT